MAAAASHGSSRALPPVSVRKGIGCTVYYTIPYISLWRTVSERFPWIPRSIPSIDPCVTVAIQGKSHRGFAPPLQYWLLTPELQQQSRGQTAYLTGGTLWAAAVAAGAASPSGLRWPLQRASSGVGGGITMGYLCPFETGRVPLKYCGNPGANWRSLQGWGITLTTYLAVRWLLVRGLCWGMGDRGEWVSQGRR